jgi:hypothetical protein
MDLRQGPRLSFGWFGENIVLRVVEELACVGFGNTWHVFAEGRVNIDLFRKFSTVTFESCQREILI